MIWRITLIIAVFLWPSAASSQSTPTLQINLTYPQLGKPLSFSRLTFLPTPQDAPRRAKIDSYAASTSNCVKTVRDAGFDVPRSANGWAGTIPTNTNKISEGQIAMAVTTDGAHGHLLVVKMINGKLVSIIEGNFPNGVGRIVPPSTVKGFIVS